MEFDFSGKSVLVTGAGSGIGREIANGFAAVGANLLASDLNMNALNSLQKEVGGSGLKVHVAQADVSKPEDLRVLFGHDSVRDLDVFVHCAGVTMARTFTQTAYEEYRKLIEINLTGTFLCMQSALNNMRQSGKGGSVIVITSINALWPLPAQAVYTATKAAMESMVKTAAAEVAPLNIRVNSIAPGVINTPLLEGMTAERRTELGERIPLKRLGRPNDLAGTALFLASPWAGYITGSCVVVDGGFIVSR